MWQFRGLLRKMSRGAALVTCTALVAIGCSAYGGETVGAPGSDVRQVQTDGEHCMVTLPDGWTWLPASWTAVSPRGTQMAFKESIYGRPANPDWDEAKRSAIEEVRKRVANVEITEDEDTVRIDFGSDGGLTVLQKFDRVGCQLTFSRAEGARAQEIEQWEQIIDSLERTSPTENYTPVP